MDSSLPIRRYGPAYRQKYASKLLASHRQAMRAIERCRTAALGGQVFRCAACEETHYSHHSCRNRHCPKCQNEKAQAWLEKQQDLLLSVPYFLLPSTKSRALTRACSMICSSQPPQRRRNNWHKSRVGSVDRLGWWGCCTPRDATWPTIRMFTI